MASDLPAPGAPVLGHCVYGQGSEKVLALHDWMGDAASYDAMIPLLDPTEYMYVFADLRGYGRSRYLSGDFSAAEVAADAFRLADHLGWDRFHVIGHSMRKTFGEWYAHVNFAFVTDAGHYPMQETPIYLATLIERFLEIHRGEGLDRGEHCATKAQRMPPHAESAEGR